MKIFTKFLRQFLKIQAYLCKFRYLKIFTNLLEFLEILET